jgi:hypothetical protein
LKSKLGLVAGLGRAGEHTADFRNFCHCGPVWFNFLGLVMDHHLFPDAVAVHFKRRHRKPLVAAKRTGKVLRFSLARRGVRLGPGEPERQPAKAASL